MWQLALGMVLTEGVSGGCTWLGRVSGGDKKEGLAGSGSTEVRD